MGVDVRRRHSAFRAHHGRWCRIGRSPLRDRRRSAACWSTCIATKPTIRCRAISRRWPRETHRLGLQGRVAGSHLTSMHSMDNYYVSKLMPLMAEAGVARHRQSADQHRAAGPPRHLSQAPRHDPRAGDARPTASPCAFGQDCVMDPWYSLGSADMLEVGAYGPPRRAR